MSDHSPMCALLVRHEACDCQDFRPLTEWPSFTGLTLGQRIRRIEIYLWGPDGEPSNRVLDETAEEKPER